MRVCARVGIKGNGIIRSAVRKNDTSKIVVVLCSSHVFFIILTIAKVTVVQRAVVRSISLTFKYNI